MSYHPINIMLEQIQPSPSDILCLYCLQTASRVCCSERCGQYPFICSADSECLNGLYIARKIHNHQNNDSIESIPIDEFNDNIHKIKRHQVDLVEKHTIPIDNQFNRIKNKIDQIYQQCTTYIESSLPIKLYKTLQTILDKMDRPSGLNYLKGKEINSLLLGSNLFETDTSLPQEIIIMESNLKSLFDRIAGLIEKFDPLQGLQTYQNQRKDQEHQEHQEFKEQEYQEYQHQQISNNASPKLRQNKQQSTSANQQRALVYIEHAKQLRNRQLTQKAIKELEKARRTDPQNWETYFLLAQYHYESTNKKTRYNEVMRHYNHAKRLNPTASCVYNGMAVVKYDQRKYDQALKLHNKAIELDPSQSNYHWNKGNTLLISKRCKEAIECFITSMNLFKQLGSKGVFCLAVGSCYFEIKQYDKALKYFELAVKMDMHDVQAHQWRKRTIQRMENEKSKQRSRETENMSYD